MVIKANQNLTYGYMELLFQKQNDFNPALPAREVFVLGIFLALLQVMDGFFTCMGMDRFGIGMEGNPLIRDLMLEFGYVPTLATVKLACVLVVLTMTVYSKQIPWIKNAMGAVSCVYLFVAILPWTYILFIQPAMA